MRLAPMASGARKASVRAIWASSAGRSWGLSGGARTTTWAKPAAKAEANRSWPAWKTEKSESGMTFAGRPPAKRAIMFMSGRPCCSSWRRRIGRAPPARR